VVLLENKADIAPDENEFMLARRIKAVSVDSEFAGVGAHVEARAKEVLQG